MVQNSAEARKNASKKQPSTKRNPPPKRRRTATRTPGKNKKTPMSVKERLEKERKPKKNRALRAEYERLKKGVFSLFSRQEVEELAHKCGFYQREPQQIRAFEFVLCCALGAMVEQKRGFATVWRILAAVVNVCVARSAVTQRFTEGSAALLETLFFRVLEKLPPAAPSIDRSKLNQFREVIAQDGTVLKLSPLLKSLFPATRTNVVDAAGKVHVAADLLDRRIIDVSVTGERESELEEFYKMNDFKPGTLYLVDLGYYSYDLFSIIQHSKAFLLMRLKDGANPKVLRVREGIKQPRSSEGRKLKEVQICKTKTCFDLDAEFTCTEFAETVTMRIVGLKNPETGCYHRYVTNLPQDLFSALELSTLYRQRWIIELLMKFLKSYCHLDHLDTGKPYALRTHLYASMLAAVILQSLIVSSAESGEIPVEQISFLTVGIAAPLIIVPFLLLWLERNFTEEDIAAMIVRTINFCCRDQNLRRTRQSTRNLR